MNRITKEKMLPLASTPMPNSGFLVYLYIPRLPFAFPLKTPVYSRQLHSIGSQSVVNGLHGQQPIEPFEYMLIASKPLLKSSVRVFNCFLALHHGSN